MNLFEIILSPFLLFIEQIFLLSFKLTHSYGAAILLLSFAVSALLLPIFIFIEKAKRKDDLIKFKMNPFVDEIKRVYKGQERYYYIKTLNRQHGYSPLRALIPILSLLIQIPFFIAAYQFLEGFEPLQGVSFGPLKDLSQADGLIGGVHLLPILMTVVNLVTAWFYTRLGDGSERKQMLIVAAAFLILLYKLPSGLVLYWTMNNVFSFVRLFITNPEVFRAKNSIRLRHEFKSSPRRSLTIKPILSQFKKVIIFIASIAFLSQLNWAFQNSFEGFVLRIIAIIIGSPFIAIIFVIVYQLYKKYNSLVHQIKVKPILFFSLIFSVCYFYFSGLYYFGSNNVALLRLAALILIPTQLIGLIYVKKGLLNYKYGFTLILLLGLTFSFVSQMLNLSASLQGKDILFDFLNIKLTVSKYGLPGFVLSGMLFSFFTLPSYVKSIKIKIPFIKGSHIWLFVVAVLYISGLMFIWNPLIVYSSYPDFFDFRIIEIVNHNVGLVMATSVPIILLYSLVSKKLKTIFLYLFIVFALMFFVNVFIVPIDLGTLQVSKFSSQENLAAPIHNYVFECLFLLAVLIGVYWVFQRNKFNLLLYLLLILNLAIIGEGSINALRVNKEEPTAVLGSGNINFSKNKQNVVLLLYDGFQGWFMDKMLKEDPELKKSLEGFVWYPNTLSISSLTYSSTAGIMCGYDYSVDKLNADSTATLREKVNIPCNLFIDRIKDEGYSLSSSKMWHSNIDKTQYDNFIPSWHESWDKKLEHGEQWEIWYTRLWENALFYSVPLAFKPKIYNDQDWLVKNDKNKTTSETYKYNFLRLLPLISKSNSKEPNFIYLHNMAPHSPWNKLNDEYNVEYKVSPYENNKWCLYRFVDWINWMKDNDVYDNTKIILLSDHGPTWNEYEGGFNHPSPLKMDNNNPDIIDLDRFWRLNALLLVKDFATKGELKEDWRLMSNADASYIIFDEDNPMVGEPKDRRLPTSWAYWEKKILYQHQYKMYKYFTVSDNIFDLENWTEEEMDFSGR